MKFILGSSSPQRLELLKNIGVIPDQVISPNVDESINRNEAPQNYVKRISFEKMDSLKENNSNSIILTADTIAYCGNRLIDKTDKPEIAIQNLNLLSGKRHKVITSLCILDNDKNLITKSVISTILMKRLSKNEIDQYITSNEWVNVAGSYKIQGQAESFIKFINGSYSNIVGLPLYETRNVLRSVGAI